MSELSRRGFLQSTAALAGGLLLRFSLPDTLRADTAQSAKLNAFVHIAPDDRVTLYIHKAEMGQGTVTSLSLLLAEELECNWQAIRTEFPGISPEYGSNQGVVGSASIRTSWEPLRKAGATAREMLISAAAEKFGVDRSTCHAANGAVTNASGARLTFGSLTEAASKLPVPANVTLKDAANFRLIGKPTKRLDTPSKVDGSARFGIDVRLSGMLYAVVARCPVFGGKVAHFDASQAKSTPGVSHVVQISTGVAVVANNTWSAMQGRRALRIQWDEGAIASVNSAGIASSFAASMAQPGAQARMVGDAVAQLAAAGDNVKKIEAVYQAPYLAHAPMEPLNCTAVVRHDSCEVWASTQGQTAARAVAAQVTGLPLESVQVHTEYMGGGFGRRARADYIGEAVEVAKAVGTAVKLTWSREDDLQQDFYRPASYTRFVAALDPDGFPSVFTARIASPPFGGVRGGLSRVAVEGIADIHYAIPHILVDYHAIDPGIPVSYWRSVGYSQNTFFAECFLDELASAGGKDPVDLRRRLLKGSPRLVAVLDRAAREAGWGQELPKGVGRGVAVVNNIGSFTAQVAEVEVIGGKLRVRRVVCAVDCGQVVNPSGVEQQIKSGIVFGLSAALKGGITIEHGRVQQQNFHQYDVLRMDEMPRIEVHLIPSQASPGGIGEASTPPIAPAICNAIFAATGKRVRQLPIRPEDLA